MRLWIVSVSMLLAVCAGCGTSRWSDTQRTATEQLLLSDAMDRAVDRLDFQALRGKAVYLDAAAIKATTDALYLASTLRQQMLAQGCIVKDKRDDADYVVEVRAGAVGTDHREVLFGVPSTRVPEVFPAQGGPATIPELPLAKKTEQRAVAKIALFAYNRETGRPVWQSGTVPVESKVKDVWVLGAGPFQRGTITGGTKVADSKVKIPLLDPSEPDPDRPYLGVTDEAVFPEPRYQLARAAQPRTSKASPKEAVGPTEQRPPLHGSLDAVFDREPSAKKATAAYSEPPLKAATPGKPADPPGPLDAITPASHNEPSGSFSPQPATGIDGFWTTAPSSEAPGAPQSLPSSVPFLRSTPSSSGTAPAAPPTTAPYGGLPHGVIPWGKG
jgi:hypothetical protein